MTIKLSSRKPVEFGRRLNAGLVQYNVSAMLVGERIRAIREPKNLSQGDIEHHSGLLRCYTSRIENGHTVPSLETLEKLARALEVPLYQLFYDGDEPPKPARLPRSGTGEDLWDGSRKDSRMLGQFWRALSRMTERRRQHLFSLAHAMARRK
jgi:transcriptional regulator with XRE-family HTH domain